MSKYRIAPLPTGSTDLEDCFPDWNAHPLRGGFTQRLYRHVGGVSQDHSFQVAGEDGQPLLLARCTKGGEELSYYGLPMVLAPRAGAAAKQVRGALSAAFDHLAELAAQTGAARAVIGGEATASPGPLEAICVDRLATGQIQASAMVNLAEPAERLRADIRDSYRSLTNWGQRCIEMKYVTAGQPDRALFDLFPDFHARIAGGSRRGPEYWGVYWDEILAGTAELALGWLADGSLVSGSIVVRAGATAYYASGVYDRDQFDKPLGHWPLWATILRAKEQGAAWFDLGAIPPRGEASDKEINIAFFKRGFTSHRHLRIKWTLPF